VKPRSSEVSAQPAERVYGLSAALATFERRPTAVLNIAYTKDARQALAEMLREAARLRIAYREVDGTTLASMAESVHHEGVCLLVRPRENQSIASIAAGLGEQCLVVALDGVQNPHNVGAILRSAAYFGADALIYSSEHDKPLPAAARRVAEGGAERLVVCAVPDLSAALGSFVERGLSLVGCDTRAKLRLDGFRWPRRALLVLGHEQHGLSAPVRSMCQSLVRIAGADTIDSLNVSVTAGIFLASFGAAQSARSGKP
jgi:TrmH RNA methyltransferase